MLRSGWRWPFLFLGIPVAVVAVLAFRIPEPPRGQWEKQRVLGEVIEDDEAAPISMEAAFARLMRIRTLRTVIIGFAALGFSLFTVPVLASLYMEEHFGLDVSNAASSRRSPGSAACRPAVARRDTSTGLPARPGRERCD